MDLLLRVMRSGLVALALTLGGTVSVLGDEGMPDPFAERRAAVHDHVAILIPEAKAGKRESQFELGFLYLDETLMFLPPMALKNGNPDGLSEVIRTGFHWIEIAAEEGYTPAQNFLADYWLTTTIEERDPELAAKWLEKAAKSQDLWALYRLAELHGNGTIESANASKSYQLYREAAGLGYLRALPKLAYAHFSGKGVPKNLERAYMWGLVAKRNEAKGLGLLMKRLQKDLNKTQREAAHKQADLWISQQPNPITAEMLIPSWCFKDGRKARFAYSAAESSICR